MERQWFSVLSLWISSKTEIWAKGLVSNFARRPQGNDRAQVKAIYEGLCDIALINNYYFGKLKKAYTLDTTHYKHVNKKKHEIISQATDTHLPGAAGR